MSIFGDVRLDRRLDWMMERIVSTGSVVLRRLGQDRAGELAAHRFLDNDRIEVGEIISTFSERAGARCAGRRIIAAQDTTEINFSGRDRGRTGLGAGGNGDALGFFIHPVIAIDRDDEAVVGLVDAQIWTREDAALPPHRSRIFADKESYRWLVGAERSQQRLAAAESVVMVGDREADIYALFARCPKAIDLVVRSAYDRSLSDDTRLLESLADLPDFGAMEVKVSARPGQKARLARVRLRAGKINLRRPQNRLDDGDPKALCLTVVESYEVQPPKGVKPLNWRLLTNLAVDDEANAREIIHIYRQRWRIEEVFRALKSTGLRLEETQVEAAHRLFKLAALAMSAAVRIIQLVDARDASARPAKDVIENAFGGDGNDVLIGNSSANLLFGGRGGDTLFGGAGDNTLDGGTGNDLFVIESGNDVIKGFVAGDRSNDLIDLASLAGVTNFAFLQSLASDDGTSTTINFTVDNSLTLTGVRAGDLTAGDFVLAAGVPGEFEISDASANKGDGAITFTVNRLSGSDGAVSVDFETMNGGGGTFAPDDFWPFPAR